MKKFLAILMCFALVLGLCGCGTSTVTSEVIVYEDDETESETASEKDDSSSTKNDSSSSSKVEAPKDKVTLTLQDSSIKSYSVVYPQNSTCLRDAAKELAAAIKAVTGFDIKTSYTCKTDYGIFIDTEAVEGKMPNGYKVSFNGGDLNITGESVAATLAAAKAFSKEISSLKADKNYSANYKLSGKIDFTTIKNTDSKLRYIGRWRNLSGTMVSSWNKSYVTLSFEGTTLVCDMTVTQNAMTGKTNGTVAVSIDGGEETAMTPQNGKLVIDMDEGKHTVTLSGSGANSLNIKNFYIEKGSALSEVKDRTNVLFIGDSITHAMTYSRVAAAKLNWDYSVVAQSGMALTDTWGFYAPPDGGERVGMETAFFKNESPAATNNFTDYEFKYGEVPDVVVIFLGTNDIGAGQHTSEKDQNTFANNYSNFIGNIRAKYPNCKVYMLQALSGAQARYDGIKLAHKTASAKYKDVSLIPTDTYGIEISDDGTHPTQQGYTHMGEKVAEYLSANYKK